MEDFNACTDNELREFVTDKTNIPVLRDQELLDLYRELTISGRTPLPVPMILIAEIQSRGLNQLEDKELYGEYNDD